MRDAPTTTARQPAPTLFLILGLAIAAALVLLLFWFWTQQSRSGTAEFAAARPGAAFAALKTLLGDSKVLRATAATLGTWVVGFGVAAALGLPLGLLIARKRNLGALIWPSLLVIAALPLPLLVLLFMVWEGLESSTGAQAAGGLIAFVAVIAVSSQARGEGDAAAAWAGALRALAVGAALALPGVVFAEGMTSGQNRIGGIALQAVSTLEIPRVFALTIYLWALGLVLALPFALAGWIVGRRR
jgi:ABC-type nitrate/sulfonate/bicarbonate transport system permease component